MTRTVSLYIALIWGITTLPTSANTWLKSVPTGSWGGAHIRLDVTDAGASIEYDCAVGTIDEPLLLDKEGNFAAQGTYVFERGGPVRLGEPVLEGHPVLYRGSVEGNRMRLTVTLVETGKSVGTFMLGLGHPAMMEKCL